MVRLRGLFKKQAELVLASRQQALAYAIVLALLPYCAWLATVVIALVTLRKGPREGARILSVVILAHGALLCLSMPLHVVICNMLLVFAPVYFAAYVLRVTANWQSVSAFLFLVVILSSLFIQQIAPEWVMSQFTVIQSLVQASQSDQALAKWLHDTSGIPVVALANYALGIQLMSGVLSVLTALLFARSLQSPLPLFSLILHGGSQIQQYFFLLQILLYFVELNNYVHTLVSLSLCHPKPPGF